MGMLQNQQALAQNRFQREQDAAQRRIDQGRPGNFRENVGGTTGGSWAGKGKRQWGGFAAPTPRKQAFNPFLQEQQGNEQRDEASFFFPKAFAKHGHGPLGAGTGDTTMASLGLKEQSEQMDKAKHNVFEGEEKQLPPGFFTGNMPMKGSDDMWDLPPLGSPGTHVGKGGYHEEKWMVGDPKDDIGGYRKGIPGSGLLGHGFGPGPGTFSGGWGAEFKDRSAKGKLIQAGESPWGFMEELGGRSLGPVPVDAW